MADILEVRYYQSQYTQQQAENDLKKYGFRTNKVKIVDGEEGGPYFAYFQNPKIQGYGEVLVMISDGKYFLKTDFKIPDGVKLPLAINNVLISKPSQLRTSSSKQKTIDYIPPYKPNNAPETIEEALFGQKEFYDKIYKINKIKEEARKKNIAGIYNNVRIKIPGTANTPELQFDDVPYDDETLKAIKDVLDFKDKSDKDLFYEEQKRKELENYLLTDEEVQKKVIEKLKNKTISLLNLENLTPASVEEADTLAKQIIHNLRREIEEQPKFNGPVPIENAFKKTIPKRNELRIAEKFAETVNKILVRKLISGDRSSAIGEIEEEFRNTNNNLDRYLERYRQIRDERDKKINSIYRSLGIGEIEEEKPKSKTEKQSYLLPRDITLNPQNISLQPQQQNLNNIYQPSENQLYVPQTQQLPSNIESIFQSPDTVRAPGRTRVPGTLYGDEENATSLSPREIQERLIQLAPAPINRRESQQLPSNIESIFQPSDRIRVPDNLYGDEEDATSLSPREIQAALLQQPPPPPIRRNRRETQQLPANIESIFQPSDRIIVPPPPPPPLPSLEQLQEDQFYTPPTSPTIRRREIREIVESDEERVKRVKREAEKIKLENAKKFINQLEEELKNPELSKKVKEVKRNAIDETRRRNNLETKKEQQAFVANINDIQTGLTRLKKRRTNAEISKDKRIEENLKEYERTLFDRKLDYDQRKEALESLKEKLKIADEKDLNSFHLTKKAETERTRALYGKGYYIGNAYYQGKKGKKNKYTKPLFIF